MPQLVFIHGPGAGGCADAYTYQLRHFPKSVAPTLPGHPVGPRCLDVARYAEWVRGWLWAQGLNRELVLVGYTLGASISLQYALDYPEEVKGIIIMTVAARPKTRPADVQEMRLRAAVDPVAHEKWLDYNRRTMHLVEPGLRERLLQRHREIGPLIQLEDIRAIDAFDVRDRIATLKPKVLLLRGLQDPGHPPEYEKEIHEAVPGSRYIKFEDAGHFPPTEVPEKFNRLVEAFLATL